MNTKAKLFVVLALVVATIAMLFGVLPVAPVTGDVAYIDTGTVLNGMKLALADKPGTQIFYNGTSYIFAWAFRDGVMFVGINGTTGKMLDCVDQIGQGGNFVNFQTMKDLATYLGASGWIKITGELVPDFIHSAVSVGSSWFQAAASSAMPTFIIMPATNPAIQIVYPHVES